MTDYPNTVIPNEAIGTVEFVLECKNPISITASFMVPQEYTISDTAKTYQIMPFTTDPPGCPVTYTYAVGPPAAQDVVSFDEATLTFTFFNDQDVGIAMNTPYGILITGEAGTVTTVQAMS